MEVKLSLINNYNTWEWQFSVIMVCFVFSIDNRKEWILSFLSLQIFNIAVVLPSEIQLSIWEVRIPLTCYRRHMLVPVPFHVHNFHHVLCVQWVKMKDWYWWNCWPSLLTLSFHYYMVVIFVSSETPICLPCCVYFTSTFFYWNSLGIFRLLLQHWTVLSL